MWFGRIELGLGHSEEWIRLGRYSFRPVDFARFAPEGSRFGSRLADEGGRGIAWPKSRKRSSSHVTNAHCQHIFLPSSRAILSDSRRATAPGFNAERFRQIRQKTAERRLPKDISERYFYVVICCSNMAAKKKKKFQKQSARSLKRNTRSFRITSTTAVTSPF